MKTAFPCGGVVSKQVMSKSDAYRLHIVIRNTAEWRVLTNIFLAGIISKP